MIFKAGEHNWEQGFLYVDLLSTLVILSLSVTLFFSSTLNLMMARREEETRYEKSRKAYESILLEQIQM